MGILSAITGAALFYALLLPLLSPCFSWAWAKKELGLALGAWKRRSSAYCACKRREGFTLIELSIVLVIIGLLVGGVLVGQDLIKAAALRAQITQIERLNTAANTFRAKYNALPGDIQNAANLGFVARAGTPGRGDGNGIVQSYDSHNGNAVVGWFQVGETLFFWSDLSSANLIEGSFTFAKDWAQNCCDPNTGGDFPAADLGMLLPPAKIGQGNFISVIGVTSSNPYAQTNVNYFCLSGITGVSVGGDINAQPALSVAQAYNIDKKIDDGMPTSGRVAAFYSIGTANSGIVLDSIAIRGAPNAVSPSSSTCYDTTSNQYSMSQNGGAGMKCTLSFQFQ